MFTPQNLAKLNETLTFREIEELVKEQERLQSTEKASQLLKRKAREARIEVNKSKWAIKTLIAGASQRSTRTSPQRTALSR